MELLTVVIIMGILATLSFNYYGSMRENVLNKQAQGDLKLLGAAQRNFRMDNRVYYPDPLSSTADHADINAKLRVLLSTSADARSRPWNFEVWSNGCSRATRNGSDGRSWFLAIDDADGEPDKGEGCP